MPRVHREVQQRLLTGRSDHDGVLSGRRDGWERANRHRVDVGALNVNPDQAVQAVERLQTDGRRLAREVTDLKTRLATGGSSTGGEDEVEVAGIKLARRKLAEVDKDALRRVADSLKAKIKTGVVVLAAGNDGKVQVVVAVTPDLTSRIKAGQIVKEIAPIVGGGGGGRPDFAEAGGKQPEKIDEMLEASRTVIEKLLSPA